MHVVRKFLGAAGSPLRKVRLLGALWVGLGLPIGAAAIAVTPWFWALLAILFAVVQVRYFAIRCPRCGRFPYSLIPLTSFARCYACGASVR